MNSSLNSVSTCLKVVDTRRPSHTTSGETEYCDPFYGCYPATVANKAEQGQVNIGLIYRFGK